MTTKKFDTKDDLKTQLDNVTKKSKIWMFVGIGAGIAFLGALAYIFLGGK